MSGGKLLKLVVPSVTKALKPSAAGVRHQTGRCGIDPYKPRPPPPPPMPEKFPEHLMRPPCMKTTEPGRFPPDCAGLQGFYCPPQRLQYKYPPFSENIDFIPSAEVDCWWAKKPVCTVHDEEEDLPINVR